MHDIINAANYILRQFRGTMYLIPDCAFKIIQTGLREDFVDNLLHMFKWQDFGSNLLCERESTAHYQNRMTHIMCYWLFRGPHVCYCLSENLDSKSDFFYFIYKQWASKIKLNRNNYSQCQASKQYYGSYLLWCGKPRHCLVRDRCDLKQALWYILYSTES